MSIVRPAEPDVARGVPLNDLASMTGEVAPRLDAAWREITRTSSFIGGPWVDRFEEDWARYCERSMCIGVANGTDSIELIMRALGIGAGDEVIIPANTFVATVEAAVMAGVTPRFVDVDPGTLMLSTAAIADAITPRTAAIIAVDLYGNLPDMGSIADLARQKHLALIEDAAQAHGARWRGSRAGSFGVAASFSFYPGKNLGAFGDAGAVVTDDQALADRIRQLANHGRPRGENHVHDVIARNSRMDALQAAVLSAKLVELDTWNQARRTAAGRYMDLLAPSGIEVMRVEWDVECVFHQFVIQVDHRDGVRAELARLGIETGIHYPIPCHHQRPYAAFALDPLPWVERAAGRVLSLPLFPHITDRQISRVASCLLDAVGSMGEAP